jgi:hypothetical protein
MWFRVQLRKDGSIASCASVEAGKSDGEHVRYIEAPDRAKACAEALAWWERQGSLRTFATVLEYQYEWLQLAGTDWTPRRWLNMNRDLAEASRRAKLPFVVTPNDLRRTFASWLIEAGVTREEVAKMLGHRGTAMVFRVYGRADPAKEGESIRRRIGNEIGKPAVCQGSACTDPAQSPFCSGPEGAGAACFPG